MKLLANAHISHLMVEFLRSVGHDCVRVEDLKPGMPDEELVSVAHREGRVIVTADKDFGELIYRRLLPAVGIILLRLTAASERERCELLEANWNVAVQAAPGHFVVITNKSVRRTPLPVRASNGE